MKIENRGGKRENSGRKPNNKESFKIRCLPENIEKIRKYIKDNNF